MGSQGREDEPQGDGVGGQGGSWRTDQCHIRMFISQVEQLGSETDRAMQGSRVGN